MWYIDVSTSIKPLEFSNSVYDNFLFLASQKYLYYLREFLHAIYMFFPPYAVGNAMLKVTRNQLYSDVMDSLSDSSEGQNYANPLGWQVAGINILVLVAETLFFFIMNFIVEFRLCNNW